MGNWGSGLGGKGGGEPLSAADGNLNSQLEGTNTGNWRWIWEAMLTGTTENIKAFCILHFLLFAIELGAVGFLHGRSYGGDHAGLDMVV